MGEVNGEVVMMEQNDVARLGFWSAVLVIIWVSLFALALCIGLLGLRTLPLAFFASFWLAISFVVMMTSIHHHAPPERRIWSQLGVSFALIYAVLVDIVYFVQLTAARGEPGPSLRPFAYAPGTVFFALDMLGYAFMCLSTLFAAPVFIDKDPNSVWTRRLFILHGLFAFSSLAVPRFMTDHPGNSEWDVGGTIALLVWCAVFLPLASLVASRFRRLRS